MSRRISILGSTGSIGTQALKVVRALDYSVGAVAAEKNISLLEQQIREFKPELAAVTNELAAAELRVRIADTNTKVVAGMEGLCEAAELSSCDTVLNSVVGMVGLQPTLTAIEAKKTIALANKETLVAGGELVMSAAARNQVEILPVDSEHSAIFQCLQGVPKKEFLKKIILTASGGPFFGKTVEQLKTVTLDDALNHPNWSMGCKITVDSATLMNKGLEIIEAVWLFSVSVDQIEVVVHRESVIHSLIELTDNSVLAQLGVPDMGIPIQYALTYPDRMPSEIKPLSLTKYGKLTFFEPDYQTFSCLSSCIDAIRIGGTAPAAANSANEAAVALFLSGRIHFHEIGEIVAETVKNHKAKPIRTLADVLEADASARHQVELL